MQRARYVERRLLQIRLLANAIIALLSTLVAIAAKLVWNLLMFAIHQTRATSNEPESRRHQQQALFKSSAALGNVMTDSLKMVRTWHGRLPNATLRCLFPATQGRISSVEGLAAGGFSSHIVELLRPTVFGIWYWLP